MSNGTLDRVILSYPTVVNLKDATGTPPSSWIQLAKTVAFVSKRYGKFAIDPSDLRMMAANFRPDVTPIDYDHLTSEVTKPGDGIAAGWLKAIELRDGGKTLWGLVEWTPDAAKRIENREYRFISPSFMKDYTTPTGEKVGTKLLAGALTNLPFLPEMASVTLGADGVFGQFALSLPAENNTVMSSTVHHLAEVGQRVTFKDDAERTPELTAAERHQTFIVESAIGDGDDQFVRLATAEGEELGWFRATQLAPARPNANPIPADRQQQENTTMHANNNGDDELIALSNTIAQERGISLRDATIEAGRRLPALAERRRADIGVDATTTDDADILSRPVINLRDGESFFALCQRTAAERQIHLSQAIRLVGHAHPNLAEAYGRGEF